MSVLNEIKQAVNFYKNIDNKKAVQRVLVSTVDDLHEVAKKADVVFNANNHYGVGVTLLKLAFPKLTETILAEAAAMEKREEERMKREQEQREQELRRHEDFTLKPKASWIPPHLRAEQNRN